MTAGRIIFPGYMPARDSNGDALPYAKAYFYENESVTLDTVYSDSGLSVEHANPVEADSDGQWPAIYADTTEEFTVYLTDQNGAPIAGPWDGMSSSSGASTAAVALAEAARDDAADSAASALGAPGTSATSTTSLAIGSGSKVFTLTQTGKAFSEGQRVVAASDANPANQMSGIITSFVDPTLTVSVDTTAGSGTLADWIISLTGQGAVSSVAGLTGAVAVAPLKSALSLSSVQDLAVAGRVGIWIPATAMIPRTTNGAAAGLGETTTNRVMRRTYDFDASTIEYVQFSMQMPKSWDEGTVTFAPWWSHPSTATNFKVSWGLQAVALSNDDALDTAFGTAQFSNDTGGTTDDLYKGDESSAITIAGSPAAEDVVIFQIQRKADDATNDTMTVDARLHGIMLYITTAAAIDT